ncbi:MAG TPA: hypothetical protein VL137_09830, partial [Polyangiaceae bacterium]|nr:hypothetical protein [Polyangiaceae bacterium]
RLLELAETLDPTNQVVKGLHASVVLGASKDTPEDTASLEAKAQANPNDFRIHQQLDYAWAKHRRYDRVIPMWTDYLQRNPQDGPAYFERAGAYHNSGHRAEAQSDVEKACELGVNAACAYAKMGEHN